MYIFWAWKIHPDRSANRDFSIRIQLGCLLHDASEAYLSDITLPVKKELTKYIKIEQKLEKVIYDTYGLSDLTVDELQLIKGIDDAMLSYEMKSLLNIPIESKIQLVNEYNLSFRAMREVKEEFINSVKRLQQAMLVIH